MTALARALSAEVLKTKRTLALLVAAALPLVIVLLTFFLFARNPRSMDGINGWQEIMNNNLTLWTILVMPLYITLQTALLGGLEHSNQGWKHLFAQPLPRPAIYAAKLIMAFALVALSLIVLVIGAWGSATLAHGLNNHPAAWTSSSGFDWNTALRMIALIYLLSPLIITIHTWVALRFPSFALASAIGIAATITSFLLINDEVLRQYFPWTLSILVVIPLRGNDVPVPNLALPLAISLIGAFVVSVLGGWDVTRKDVL